LTGEVLLSAALTRKLTGLTSIINTNTINVVYDKSSWEKGDIKPENLYRCKNTDDGNVIQYNGGNSDHIMAYDIGYGQTVEVNTTADQVFGTSVKRDVADLQRIVDQMNELDAMKKSMIQKKEEAAGDLNLQNHIQQEIDTVQKAYDYLKEDLKDAFGKKVSSFQEAMNRSSVAVTENGTRSKRLEMIQTRLQTQLTTFKTLQSDNEDIDLAETATNLSTAELTYQASLMATSKIMQQSLMNYI
jgi:flagellar hook-associated protein 3 FlgL